MTTTRLSVTALLVATLAFLAGCAATTKPESPSANPTGSTTDPGIPVAQEPVVDSSRAPARSPIVQGTGRLYGTPETRTETANEPGGMQLAFTDTDIATVVATVLGEALGYQYVIDPQITGNITLQSTSPVGRSQLFIALEAALRLQDVALVPVGTGYHVVRLKDAPRQVQSLVTPESKGLPGYGIEVVPLQFASASEIEKLLAPVAAPGSVLRVDEARNLLLLAGTSQERAAMMDMIRVFDTDLMAGMSFALFQPEHVDAAILAGELKEVLGGSKGGAASVVRLVPIPRLNAILAVSPQAHYLEEIESWIQRLDVANSTPGRRINVYDVQNGKAADLAASLGRIFSESPALGANTATGSASQPGGSDKVAATTSWQAGGLRVVPSDESNSLLILATPSEYAVIEDALKKLDVPPRQVLIEATLAEVTLNDQLRFGVQWFFQGADGTVTLSQASNGGIASVFPGFSYLYTGSSRVDAVLNALEGITNVNVVSSPKLLVLNNHEATLQVGDQVPIVTQSAVAVANSNAPIVNSVQMRDTGVILRVTPRVNKGGLVILEVSQEISDVSATTTSGIDSPTIQQRRLSSTIAVHSGQTIALGGLIRETSSSSRSGIPWIQRIPLIGYLFGASDNSKRRTELIILLTPRVVRDLSSTKELTDYLREEFQSVKPALK